MCLWLITACLGILPSNPTQQNIVVVGAPSPILQPTTTTTTTARPGTITFPTLPPTITPAPPGNNTMIPPPPGNMTMPPITATPPPVTSSPMPPPVTSSPTPPPVTNSPTPPPVTNSPTTASTASPAPSQGGVLLPVILCSNPDVVCVSNPDENATGPLPIDPRLGTTPSPSAALLLPPITAYSGTVPLYDSAVKFPRQRRSLERSDMNIKDFLNGLHYEDKMKRHIVNKRQSCRCVTAGTCLGGGGTNAGAGMIDIRIVTPGGGNPGQCPAGQVYCCGATTASIACGTLQTVPPLAISPAAGQANYGEFPWQALILSKQNEYLAGGVLIDQSNVLTVTHRLVSYIVAGTAPNVKVRLGEWDAAGTYEPVPYQEYTVQKVFSHPSYNPTTLQYDITILRLSVPVPFTPAAGAATTINRACLPASNTATYNGQTCLVAGWGKDMFGVQGQYQQILKKVDVPIVPPATCQSQMQTARLGASFALDTTSFICAGGVANKDACTGDGGSGLVCNVNGQWTVVGLVAWGLGCANANVPAAYVNIAALLPWIQQQVATP